MLNLMATYHYPTPANQMLFNLDVPSMPTNMAVKFHRPEPIVIEKFGGNNASFTHSPPRGKSALRFSAVSEDSLSAAVQLARRDMKKRRDEEIVRQAADRDRPPERRGAAKKRVVGRAKTELILSKDYKARLKRRDERQKGGNQVVMVKERTRGTSARTSTTQTSRRHANASVPVVSVAGMPPMSMSPPTRDKDISSCPISADEKASREITRLREEMERCLLRVRDMKDNAARMGPAPRPVFVEDVEAARRRETRAEEQAARSSRTVYMLTQQVRDLQEDIAKVAPSSGGLQHNKKSQLLGRLATAHRGAVRALQTFAHHLPDFNLRQGPPRAYRELCSLLRQMSLCCAQLEVGGETGVPNDVLHHGNDNEGLNALIERELQAPPPASPPPSPPGPPPQNAAVAQGRNKPHAENRRGGGGGPPLARGRRTRAGAVVKATHVARQRPAAPGAGLRDFTPDRQAALRAGMEALVRAAESTPPPTSPRHVPPLDLPPSPRAPGTSHGVAWDFPLERSRLQQFRHRQGQGHDSSRKGLLLPSKLKDQRRRVEGAPPPSTPGEAHFAESTLASRLKETHPHQRATATTPPHSPRRQACCGDIEYADRSPRYGDRSPRYGDRSPRYGDRSPQYGDRSPRYGDRSHSAPATPRPTVRQDIARQIQCDREAALQRKERLHIENLRKQLGRSEAWVAEAEGRLRDRMQPLLDHSQHELNADLLANLVLHEVMEDTAREMADLAEDDGAQEEAARMADAPSLETLLQRLGQMEAEQAAIRRRWATIAYEDHDHVTSSSAPYQDTVHSETPTTPPPIELTRTRLEEPRPDHFPYTTRHSAPREDSALVFTKSAPRVVEQATLHLTDLHADRPVIGTLHQPGAEAKTDGVSLCLSREMLSGILAQRERFESDLRRRAHGSVGRFDPWQIVTQVADEIVEDCAEAVCRELDEINSDIVNHVYSTEFKRPKSEDDVTKEQGQGHSADPERSLYHSPVEGAAVSAGALQGESSS